MREIRTSTWHWKTFGWWRWFKETIFNLHGGVAPSQISLCEYARGVALGATFVPAFVIVLGAFMVCALTVYGIVWTILFVGHSIVYAIVFGTIAKPSVGDGFFDPWEGRYQIKATWRGFTVYPIHAILVTVVIVLFVWSPTARTTILEIGSNGLIALAWLVGIAFTAYAIKRFLASDAWQLTAAYAKALWDRACPVLTIVEDEQPMEGK